MVYAAVQRRVIVYRGYGKAIVGLRGPMHLQGLPQTRGGYKSHARVCRKTGESPGLLQVPGVVAARVLRAAGLFVWS